VEDLVNRAFWAARPVLVTGATGLLGASLVRLLQGAGAQVVCLVRDWVPQSEAVRSGLLERTRVVRGDVVDQPLLERVLGEYEIDTVLHLAAQTIVSIANKNPVGTLESNIRGTWCVLEAARRSPRVKQIVAASSDKAYGDQPRLPYAEDMPLQGRHPYDVSKSCSDLIAQMYAVTFGVPVCITRCGNFYGPGDLNWNRIVPGTLRSAIRGERPVIRSDGRYVRDYVYVDDGAAAYLATAEALASRRELAGEAFNFSNDTPVDVLRMVGHILEAAGRTDLVPEVRNEATHEIREQYLDSAKARRVLGWRPRFTLAQGLALTHRWYSDFLREASA
jgi:CDP-glucose 4,6-dehydratase